MRKAHKIKSGMDHCRIGSLEKAGEPDRLLGYDHCRIGSLEIHEVLEIQAFVDHCRIGSLEIDVVFLHGPVHRSLPHRQLRN